jgi:23S rRNA 5-hydroxycytidine C2501 synthase
MEHVELLAPAKDLETGMAAINCGADAVYIGASKFGAREAAGNAQNDIAGLVRYAHKYWAKVYVTVNTLLHDEELTQAERLIRELYESGVDALIIQDTGLLELDLPPLPLFASTQMHNHTPERVAFLEKVGIQRVILARELSLEQIRAIRAQTKVELEYFVHGALCVSYSGQCYMSYAIGGRSGNRGQCAQPCRRPYKLVDQAGSVLQDGRYLLSLRDLNLSAHLNELLDAGVRSFKIEGRLKDKTYVMNVVGHYRQKLDALLEKRDLRHSASGRVRFDFSPNPQKTFNRGFSDYFLHGRKAPVGSPDTPKATGEPVGKVTRLNRSSFNLDSSIELHRGDGLCFYDKKRQLTGTVVNDVQGRAIFPDKMDGLVVGTQVYRNHDHVFLSALENSKTERKIGVRFRLAAALKGLALFVQDEDGCEAMVVQEMEKNRAEKPEQALATIQKQLQKLGGTEFECTFVRVDLPEAYFIPVSVLNAMRREVLDELTQQRAENYPRKRGGAVKNDVPFPEQELTFQGNVLNQRAAAFYRRHGVTKIEPALEAQPLNSSGVSMYGRKVMTTRHCIKHQLGWCNRYGGKAENGGIAIQEPLALVDEQGNHYPLRFNCVRCEMEVYYRSIEE